jgi:hypothetical protein
MKTKVRRVRDSRLVFILKTVSSEAKEREALIKSKFTGGDGFA